MFLTVLEKFCVIEKSTCQNMSHFIYAFVKVMIILIDNIQPPLIRHFDFLRGCVLICIKKQNKKKIT